ncbi:hypothetical protein BDW68DRAFT_152221 [Aspergillus falconensis]
MEIEIDFIFGHHWCTLYTPLCLLVGPFCFYLICRLDIMKSYVYLVDDTSMRVFISRMFCHDVRLARLSCNLLTLISCSFRRGH